MACQSVTPADLFSYLTVAVLIPSAMTMALEDPRDSDVVFTFLVTLVAGELDNWDGWAVRHACGATEHGNWLDHAVVDKVGEFHGLMCCIFAWPEYKMFWNVVLLRQSFSSHDDLAHHNRGNFPRTSQNGYFTLSGCLHHYHTVLVIYRLVFNLVRGFLVALHDQSIACDLEDANDKKIRVPAASRLAQLIRVADGDYVWLKIPLWIVRAYVCQMFLVWHGSTCS